MRITTEMVEAVAMVLFARDRFVSPQLGGPWIRQSAIVKNVYRRNALYSLLGERNRRQENGKET